MPQCWAVLTGLVTQNPNPHRYMTMPFQWMDTHILTFVHTGTPNKPVLHSRVLIRITSEWLSVIDLLPVLPVPTHRDSITGHPLRTTAASATGNNTTDHSNTSEIDLVPLILVVGTCTPSILTAEPALMVSGAVGIVLPHRRSKPGAVCWIDL